MDMYRGPRDKDFQDDSHKRVHTEDLSARKWSWHTGVWIGAFNLSKDPREWQVVGHLHLERKEVLALHEGLIRGLLERSERLDAVEKSLVTMRDALWQIAMSNSADAMKEIANKALKQDAKQSSAA